MFVGHLGAGLAAKAVEPRVSLGATLAAAVASHFVLDVVVHVPDLPLAGPGSPLLGLGLWRAMPVALAVEIALALAALVAYVVVVKPPRGRAIAVVALVAATGVLTAAGPYLPGDPPPPAALALSSLATLAAVIAVGAIVDRRAVPAGKPAPAGTPAGARERL